MTAQKKNVNFVQFYRHSIDAFRILNAKNPTAGCLFLFLMKYIKGQKNGVICSPQLLQEALGKSKSTIYRAINDLTNSGLLHVSKIGTAMFYSLNHEVVWSSYNNNKKYSMYEGTVLVSYEENADLDKKMKQLQKMGNAVIDDQVIEIAM